MNGTGKAKIKRDSNKQLQRAGEAHSYYPCKPQKARGALAICVDPARPGCVDPADRALVKGARSVYQVSCTVPTIFLRPWRYLCTTKTWRG